MDTKQIAEQELTADDIFSAQDPAPVPRTFPELQKNGKPGIVYFKQLSADRLITFRREMAMSEEAKTAAFVKMFAECACDSKGTLLFQDADAVKKLRKKASAMYLRAQDFLLQMNGMTPPVKTLDTVVGILESSGVPAEVVTAVKKKWQADDDGVVKNA